MIPQSTSISVLLTYKNKLLLLSTDIREPNNKEENIWSLICWNKQHEINDKNIQSKVKSITQLDLDCISLLTQDKKRNSKYYYAKLTDDHINSMDRKSGQLLQFYALAELENLPLTHSTSIFLNHNQNLLKDLLYC